MPSSSADREPATLIGFTSLECNGSPQVEPKLNRRRALLVLAKIDEILFWEQNTERERDARFVDLGRYLCEVRAGQYWRLDNLHSFDEFLEKRFPDSRRKAYYLMAIHEQLPRQIHRELRQVGWSKAAELAKVARRDGQKFDCATWVHKAQELPKEEFAREVERHLTGQETEPWEMLYFKVYKSQLRVVEQALETAALMLGGLRRTSLAHPRRPAISRLTRSSVPPRGKNMVTAEEKHKKSEHTPHPVRREPLRQPRARDPAQTTAGHHQ